MKKKVKEIHHDVIPLADGIRLAYRAWLPVDAGQHPVVFTLTRVLKLCGTAVSLIPFLSPLFLVKPERPSGRE